MTRRLETSSFERFFLGEHPKLVALGLAWTGNVDTARELAQEALTRAYRSWDRVEQLDIPGAWVRRIMINLLIDARRAEQRHDGLQARLNVADEGSPNEPGGSDESWWRAVRALPDRERAAVTLHYIEDMSIADVAHVLEITPGTVKASLSHAREKLRTALSDKKDER